MTAEWAVRVADASALRALPPLLAAAEDVDRGAPLSEDAVPPPPDRPGDGPDQGQDTGHRDQPGVTRLTVVDPGAGRLAGYGHLEAGPTPDRPWSAELVVAPEFRRRGVGTALVRAMIERVPTAPLLVWSHGGHPGAARLAERLDLPAARTLLQLHLDLTGRVLDEPVLDPDVTLRPFRPGADEPEFLRVNNAAFSWHPEQGGWTDRQVLAREGEPWFDPAGFLLAVRAADDRLLGFHWTKVHPDGGRSGGPVGEVYVLGVDPGAQGRKLGGALTLAGLRHLHDRGLTEVMLYVESDNASAVALYERLGFTRWHTHTAYRHEASS